MTRIIVTFIDEQGLKIPKAALQAGKVYTVQLTDVKAENRYEEIEVTIKLLGCKF